MTQQFPHLFSPIKIGPMTVRNRIVSSAHVPAYDMTRLINYWVAKAKGGVGLIESQITVVHPRAEQNMFSMPGIVESFKSATDAVREHGAKFVVQLGNLAAQSGAYARPTPWAPSAVLTINTHWEQHVPHAMTRDEIEAFVEAFAHGASAAKEAGVDGVQIHGGHGYLLTEFMSPHSNIREDEYGGSLENRMRFPIEVIQAVRSAVGDDFVVGMRVSGDEFIEGGYTLDDMLVMAPMLARAGLNYLSVTAGVYSSMNTAMDPMYFPLNSFIYCGAGIKEVVDIPVFARGRITDPVQAEEILAGNQADMVSMVRAIVADPEFANKAREGRVDEIRKCLGCSEACWGALYFGRAGGMSCVMNPAVGKEGEPGWGELIPAEVKKRVMIIGGGPAGLETARVAVLRGHQVSLYDRGSELGGQTLIAAKAPGRDGWLDLVRYYTYQMKLLNVDVHLNTEVTADMVKEQDPDVVVVATGSIPLIPHIRGVDGDNVVEVRQVLNEEVQVGNNVVIIGDDEHMQSLGTADFLAEHGKKVEVLCKGYYCGVKIEPATRVTIYQRLLQKGVTLTPLTDVKEISASTVIVYNVFTNEERRIEGVDTVVVGCGGQEDNALYYALKDQVKEIYRVGDANGVRNIFDATMDGATLARAL